MELAHTLTAVEAGYAKVIDANGVVIGTVSQEKVGSTRTGTKWFAYCGRRELGSGYTRAEAVEIVVQRAVRRRTAMGR